MLIVTNRYGTCVRDSRGTVKEKWKNKIVATYVYASSQGQRKHSAQTNCPERSACNQRSNFVRPLFFWYFN